jgi:hypothetical protein
MGRRRRRRLPPDTRGYSVTSTPKLASSSVGGAATPATLDDANNNIINRLAEDDVDDVNDRHAALAPVAAPDPAENLGEAAAAGRADHAEGGVATAQQQQQKQQQQEEEEEEAQVLQGVEAAAAVEELWVQVGRERQLLLGMLQELKPSHRKVTKSLQRLSQFHCRYPSLSAADWLGPVYTSGSHHLRLGHGGAVGGGRARVLCVGCGDGSYEIGMALEGRGLGGRLTVSFYEAEARLRQRYSNFCVNATVLRALGAELLFEVDATALEASLTRQQQHSQQQHLHRAPCSPATAAAAASTLSTAASGATSSGEGRWYQRVVFNFPQTGSGFPGSESWHADHAVLLRGFFASVARSQLLLPSSAGVAGARGGEVWITLMDRAPYSDLPLDSWAHECGFRTERREAFDGGSFGLYKHRMTRYDRVVKADKASSSHVYSYCGEGT